MRFELDLLRASVEPDPKATTAPSRKDIRVTTDALIHDALLLNDLPALVERGAVVMLTTARALLLHGHDPQVIDLVEASQALVENSRAVMDRGLLLEDAATTMCGAVMLELTVRGICAALSVPYDKVLAEVHRAQVAGENPAVRAVLVEAGLITETPDE